MDTKHRAFHTNMSLASLLCLACGLAACTTTEADKGGGGGGDDGSGGGGGAIGSAETDGTLCPLPVQPMMTDFTYAGEGADTTAVNFGDSTTLSGTTYVYPTSGDYPVTSDVTDSNWHISGTLGDYTGFGLVFFNCSRLDASAYKGISFTISGSVPQGSQVTMRVATLNNAITSAWLLEHNDTEVKEGDPGRCVPTSGTNRYDQPTCADAAKNIPVTAEPTTVEVEWADFTGGKPEPGVTPGDIVRISWFFPPPTGAGTANPTPYEADIVIDDLSFIP